LRRAGCDEQFILAVAHIMEYHTAYTLYREDIER
jgi:hypothetical protein